MKVILTVHHFLPDHVTGTELIAYYLACNLRQRGHEVTIVTADPRGLEGPAAGPRVETYAYDGFTVHRVRHAGDWRARALMHRDPEFRKEYENAAIGNWFRQFLGRQRPDLVHFIHLGHLSASLIDACVATDTPCIFTATDFWAVCPLNILRLADGSMCRGPDPSAGNCVRHIGQELHTLGRASRPPTLRRRIAERLGLKEGLSTDIRARPAFLRQRFQHVARVLVPSQVMRETLLANGLAPESIRFIPYGTPVNQIERTTGKGRQGPLRVAYIGQIAEHKGCHVLAEAANLLSDVALQVRFYGNPESDPAYARRLAQMMPADAGRMQLCGPFSHGDLSRVLRDCDVLVCPSLWYENTPLVIHEAMAAGVPVVATDLPGLAEIVKPQVNGLLFPRGDARALAEVLRRLAADRDLVARLAAGTEPPVSAAQHAAQVEEVYRQVLAESDGSRPGLTLKYQVETPMPEAVEIGRGLNFILEGWAYSPQRNTSRMEIEIKDAAGRRRIAVTERANARKDVLAAESARGDAVRKRALLSGFWCLLPLTPAPEDRTLALRLVVTLDSGETLFSARQWLRIRGSGPDAGRPLPRAAALPHRPRVCICMTTYNPTEEMLRRQIDSIRDQDYDNWICLVQDDWSSGKGRRVIERVVGNDPRFVVHFNQRNLGFYANFERVLQRVSDDCQLVALSDQDDRWNPGKLSRLVACFADPDVTLAYSDMRIVDEHGTEVSPTYWTLRRNNCTDIEALFFANTVTGAASMFRSSLLPAVLPFPPCQGSRYHDWWIAMVALATGTIAYVDAPLYDYYQHGGNVVGWSPLGRNLNLRDLRRSDAYRRELVRVAQKMYNCEGQYLASAIATLRLRLPETRQESALARLARLQGRPLVTMVEQTLRSALQRRASGNRERNLLMAHIVMRLLNRYLAAALRFRAPDHAPVEQATVRPALSEGAGGQRVMPVNSFERTSRPLTLDVQPGQPQRINMLLATIDFRFFFGGYIGMFQLARQLARAGKKVRFVVIEPCEYQPDVWRRSIQNYAGLEDIFDHVEVELRADRGKPLPVNPDDRWIATSCWSAWIADNAARQLNGRPFVFMIQEYEPYFVAHGSYYALSHAAYGLNHFALFSTELLRQFFRQEHFGVYAASAADGDARSVAFHNAVLGFDVRAESLQRPAVNGIVKRKFLYYCRPEAHAQRNMFELGVLALRRAISQGTLDPALWQFYGMGTVGDQFVVPLGERNGHAASLVALPKMSLEAYAGYLPDFDLGMSLMYTPHPSLVPLEMASAGLLTVTNSYANKTAESLRAISTNLEVGEPTIDGISAALARAAARLDDIPGRVAGSHIHWPTSWQEALGPAVMARLLQALDTPTGNTVTPVFHATP